MHPAAGSGPVPRRRILLGVSSIVHVPDKLAERLAAEAARRGITVDDLSAELLAAGLTLGMVEDPLDPCSAHGRR
jgi:hypothetical protein